MASPGNRFWVYFLAVFLNPFASGQILEDESEAAPRNVQGRPLSSSTLVIQWDEPKTPNGQVTGYKVYYTINSELRMNQWQSQVVDNSRLTTVSDLIPYTIYTIGVQALFSVGKGPFSRPVNVKTQEGVPSQPNDATASEIGKTTVSIKWKKPTYSHEGIVSYKLYWNDTYTNKKHQRSFPISEELTLTGLYPNTLYYVWLAARSQGGEGAATLPLPIRTAHYVPGVPQGVQVTAIDLATIKVAWKAPLGTDHNGIITGYRIIVQEVKEEVKNIAMGFDVLGDSILESNLTGLQPDTSYFVVVSALARNEEGAQSQPLTVKTVGGVPIRPTLTLKVVEGEPTAVELGWSRPAITYGELQGYQLKFGIKLETLKDINLAANTTTYRITTLTRGAEYEFRIAGQNHNGLGQQVIKYLHIPEGLPTGAPKNIRHRFQTKDIVYITWDPPSSEYCNGKIIKYGVQFQNKSDDSYIIEYNVTTSNTVFTNLEENTEYMFYVKGYTSQGAGPYSNEVIIKTDKKIDPASISVRAMATSDSNVEVWWAPALSNKKIIGYQIFYTMNPVNDLNEWGHKMVGLTESADLANLETGGKYVVAVAAKLKKKIGKLSEKIVVEVKPTDVPLNLRVYDVTTHSITLSWLPPILLNPINYKISFDSIKEFVDSQGISQSQIIPKTEITLESTARSHVIKELLPFTTYNINVSAVSSDYDYRPPTTITATTSMTAPPPMLKPDFYSVYDVDKIQVILPQASEESGPISYYYLIVVPENRLTINKNSDQILADKANMPQTENCNSPFITAKFPKRNIPYVFNLGTDEIYEGFKNCKLELGKKYRVFVRAVVETRQKLLYTSSPFSEFLSLDMPEIEGGPSLRPNKL